MADLNKAIKSNIGKYLKLAGLTQRELAERIGTTEVSISRYVSGERIPRATTCIQIANVLNCSAEDLFEENISEELVKTCENCKYEYEDYEGTHCRHCIHNAEECFEPKVKEITETEIRNKAIDEFAERLKDKVLNHFTYRGIIEEPTEYADYIDEIAEEMRGAE